MLLSVRIPVMRNFLSLKEYINLKEIKIAIGKKKIGVLKIL